YSQPERSWQETYWARGTWRASACPSAPRSGASRARRRQNMYAADEKPMPLDALIEDAQRVLRVCNACRYCEGFCAMFPAMARRLEFTENDIHYLGNLCHNCGSCLYACQFSPPHEFQVNVPRLMARVRGETYRRYAWPGFLGKLYENNGVAVSLISAFSIALLFWIAGALG